jgi:hypothetical protein
MRFYKNEIRKIDWAIQHIRESLGDDTHDFWSALFCSGFTFSNDIKRFYKYASQIGATDISEEILKKHPEYKEI